MTAAHDDYGPSEPQDVGAEPDANYLTWLAEQQLSKQSEGELAWQQELRAAFTHDELTMPDREASEAGRRAKIQGSNGHAGGVTLNVDTPQNSNPQTGVEGLADTPPKARRKVDISKAIRAVDLLKLDLPPLRWVVPDLIPEGTTLIVAPPKIGKSSLVYQACCEVALGGELLGRKVARGSALYLALEDGPRRGQAKVLQALNGRKLNDGPTCAFDVWWNAPTIGDGLEEALRAWVESKADPVLVVIDTLERVRPQTDMRKAGAYRTDVHDVSALQSAFRDTDVALGIVHHSRKETTDDFVQAVSGTYGLTGSVDTIVSIARPRGEEYGVIRATGREVGEIELPARFADGLWLPDPAALAAVTPERLEVYEVIRKKGPIFALGVAQALRRTSESDRISIQQMMRKMMDEGVIERVKGGYSASRSASDYSDYGNGPKH